MGLFDKLFGKKECAVCGGEIGLFGNRKLEDGNLCKDCAAKLSPWFSDRRSSTVDEIKGQLTYREENRQLLEDFNTTKTLGQNVTIHFDEAKKKFLVAKTGDIRKENCDILDYSQVTNVDIDIEESSNEDEFEDADGNKKSYDPPRYFYSYQFSIIINVNHPYFDKISFALSPDYVEINPDSSCTVNRKPDPMSVFEYRKYYDMSNEIKSILLDRTKPAEAPAEAPTAPVANTVCPACNAENKAGARFCEFCGSAL